MLMQSGGVGKNNCFAYYREYGCCGDMGVAYISGAGEVAGIGFARMSDGGEALCGVKSVLSGTGAPVCGRKDRSKKRFLLFLRRVVARKMCVRYILVRFFAGISV